MRVTGQKRQEKTKLSLKVRQGFGFELINWKKKAL